jgi:hypothetical protein
MSQQWEYMQIAFDSYHLVWLDSQQHSGELERLSADVPVATYRGRASSVKVENRHWAVLLNRFGAEGWELVGEFRGALLLKRLKE